MIKKLDWDTDFFLINIGNYLYNENNNKELLEQTMINEKIEILQYKVDINDKNQIKHLEEIGFNFIDLEILYRYNINSINNNVNINENVVILEENNVNIDEIEKIVKNSFIHSRFHNFATEKKVDDFYIKWIENGILKKHDDLCYNIRYNNEIAGYVSVKYIEKDVKIGLFVISDKYRGKNIGSFAINLLIKKLYIEKKRYLYVATQGRNIKAQNFYMKNKGNIINTYLWYYKKTEKI